MSKRSDLLEIGADFVDASQALYHVGLAGLRICRHERAVGRAHERSIVSAGWVRGGVMARCVQGFGRRARWRGKRQGWEVAGAVLGGYRSWPSALVASP